MSASRTSTAPARRPAPAKTPRLTPVAVRRRHLGLVTIAASGLALIVFFGLVISNALIVQNQSRLDDLDTRIAGLEADNQQLRLDAAELQAPDRIIGAAAGLGMVQPEPSEVVVLSPLTAGEIDR